MASVPLNLAEWACRTGKDRAHAYRIAQGSAVEVRSAVRLAHVWQYVDADLVAAAEPGLDRLAALLWCLVNPRR